MLITFYSCTNLGMLKTVTMWPNLFGCHPSEHLHSFYLSHNNIRRYWTIFLYYRRYRFNIDRKSWKNREKNTSHTWIIYGTKFYFTGIYVFVRQSCLCVLACFLAHAVLVCVFSSSKKPLYFGAARNVLRFCCILIVVLIKVCAVFFMLNWITFFIQPKKTACGGGCGDDSTNLIG